MDQIRFLLDGNRLRENQTPDELEMQDDDVIDALAALGGSLRYFDPVFLSLCFWFGSQGEN